MYLDETMRSGGESNPPRCRGCKQPIGKGEHTTHVHFDEDPDGAKGLTGDYHAHCGRTFGSIARALKSLGNCYR